jgi:hypothetical protein
VSVAYQQMFIVVYFVVTQSRNFGYTLVYITVHAVRHIGV